MGDPLKCEVCREELAVGVASSMMGPISHAYGANCIAAGAEVYGTLVGGIACVGGLDHTAWWIEGVVGATLPIVGKTRAQFEADVAAAVKDMESMAQ